METIRGFYAIIQKQDNKIIVDIDEYGNWITVEADKILIDHEIHIIVMKMTEQNTYTPVKEIIVKHIDMA